MGVSCINRPHRAVVDRGHRMKPNNYSTKTEVTGTADFEDAQGQRFKTIEYTEYFDTSSLASDQREWSAGRKSYLLETGDVITEQLDQRFMVESTGARYTKVA